MTENRVLSFDAGAEFYQKRAVKMMEQQDYTGALKYLRRAVKLEPEDPELRLDVANAYALMGLYERSNLEIQLLFHRKDLPAEALFAMGSNYMAIGDYDQAEAMMQVYLKMDPDGEFAAQAGEALGYMAECDYETPLDRELDELSMDGKAALDAGDLEHAVDCLQKALEKDPGMLYVRNNLAVACYCMGDMDRAWYELDKVLEMNPLDVHGRCNESMLYLAANDREGAVEALEKLRLERIEELDELYKYCLALADAGLDQPLLQAIKKIFLQTPYDSAMLYLYGACRYNLGQYGEASRAFEKLALTDEDSLIAAWGLRIANAAQRGEKPEPARMPYAFELPKAVQEEVSQCLDTLAGQTPEQVSEALGDERICRLIRAALMTGTDAQMQQGVLLLGYSASRAGERMLREILLSPTHSTYFKQMVLQVMRSLEIPEPYYCLQDGKLVLVHSRRFSLGEELPKAYRDLLQEAVHHMSAVFNEEKAVAFAAAALSTYMMMLGGKFPKITHPFAWIKTLEGMYLEAVGGQPDWKKLAAEAGVTERTLLMRQKKLRQAGEGLMQELDIEKKDGKNE